MSAEFNEPREFTQPETGEKFTLIVDGDEFGAVFTTPSGYAVRFNSALDTWVYCDRSSNGRLMLTSHPAHEDPPDGLLRGLRDNTDVTAQARSERVHRQYYVAASPEGAAAANFTFGAQEGLLPGRTLLGDVTGLVVIVDFADEPAFDDAVALVNQLYNGPDPYLTNSTTVKGYFQAVSNNKLNFTNQVHPTVVHLPRKKWLYPDFPKSTNTLYLYILRAKLSVRPAQVDGIYVNIISHGSTPARTRACSDTTPRPDALYRALSRLDAVSDQAHVNVTHCQI